MPSFREGLGSILLLAPLNSSHLPFVPDQDTAEVHLPDNPLLCIENGFRFWTLSESQNRASTFNQYTKIGTPLPTTPNLTYDANGNLTNDSHVPANPNGYANHNSYTWDAFNRLTGCTVTGTGYLNDGTTTTLYLYDATGRRVAKYVDVYSSSSSELWTLYTYDGWRVLEERETAVVGYSPVLKRQFVYGNYLDEPLTMDVDGGSDGVCVGGETDKRYLYLQNTLFSVTGLVDASSGALVEAYAYDPYGRHWRITNAGNAITDFSASTLTFALGAESTLGNPYLFTGQRFDPETGLHYYKYRYYDCGLGRFVSRDPMHSLNPVKGSDENAPWRMYAYSRKNGRGASGGGRGIIEPDVTQATPYFDGVNLQQYVQGNPVNGIDTFGLYTIDDAIESLKERHVRPLGVPQHMPYDDRGGYTHPRPYTNQQIFDEWLRMEKEIAGWWETLPKCPKRICLRTVTRTHFLGQGYVTVSAKAAVNPDPNTWTDPNDPVDLAMAMIFHGSKVQFEIRTLGGVSGSPHGNQCTYDKDGKMIGDIPDAGSADFHGPNNGAYRLGVLAHRAHDVKTYTLSSRVGRVADYYDVRPVW